MNDTEFLMTVALIAVLIILLFLLIRRYLCWYWKINRIVELLESIDNKLVTKHQLDTVEEKVHDTEPIDYENSSYEYFCEACNMPVSESDKCCKNCGNDMSENTEE